MLGGREKVGAATPATTVQKANGQHKAGPRPDWPAQPELGLAQPRL